MAPIDIAARDNQEYVIDFISAHQGSPKHKPSLSFLVHWLGFEEEEATWEPLSGVKETEAFALYCAADKNLSKLLKWSLYKLYAYLYYYIDTCIV